MKRIGETAAKLLAGIAVAAVCATPQAYTISARPGAVNYIEGNAFLNGEPITNKGVRSTFLNANDTLSTDVGKAEVLLTPGVFLRIGENSAVKMVSPSLTGTQLEIKRGAAMLEVAGLMKDNDIQILDRNGSIRIEKDGLYRFSADDPPTAAVLEGKAQVSFDGQTIQVGKGHETVIGAALKPEKFDLTRDDDLYAWSNVRSQYDAASSYQASRSVPVSNSGAWFGNGFGNWYSPGWFWNGAFDSWAWLPGNGAFYSPFGYGFYGPGVVAYAPVVYVPVTGATTTTTKPVPVNPTKPPAIAARASSPAAYAAARAEAAHAFARTGFTTASGAHISSAQAASMASAGGGAAHASAASPASAGAAHASAGGFSGGGAHASGGGGGHR